MKLLLLDYLRRKWWILAVGAATELVLGWTTALASEYQLVSDTRTMIPVFQFQIALFMAGFLNSFDLQRGLARVVAALPVSAMQAGRAWWLSSVGLPAVALAVPLFLGAGLFDLFHPGAMFPARSLALTSIYNLLGLGSLSTAMFSQTIFFFLALRGHYRNAWSRTRWIGLAGLVNILIYGGAVLLIVCDFSPAPSLPLIIVGVGAVLTIAGWFGAGRFVRAQAGFRSSALQSANASGQSRPPAGYGGMPRFIGAAFVRCFRIGLAMEIFTPLFDRIIRHTPSWRAALESSVGSANMTNMIWMFMTFQLIPGLLHLRFLRTLPVSATRLAAVMMTLVVLPIIALGAVTAGVTGMAMGTPAALLVLKNFALILIPGVLCLYFTIRQGVGTPAIAIIFVAVVLSEALPLWLKLVFHDAEVPLSVTGAVAAGSVLLAFLLTRRSLLRSSRPYRVLPAPFGDPSWGAGR